MPTSTKITLSFNLTSFKQPLLPVETTSKSFLYISSLLVFISYLLTLALLCSKKSDKGFPTILL
ncbi:Uncharacterised protein [Chlamydia trachomatis]|nr:Uncharacterised protein [Chlamydia trachomatis]